MNILSIKIAENIWVNELLKTFSIDKFSYPLKQTYARNKRSAIKSRWFLFRKQTKNLGWKFAKRKKNNATYPEAPLSDKKGLHYIF